MPTICVRIATGTAALVKDSATAKDLRSWGLRVASEAEASTYAILKPMFDRREIKLIQLAKPKN